MFVNDSTFNQLVSNLYKQGGGGANYGLVESVKIVLRDARRQYRNIMVKYAREKQTNRKQEL